MRSSLKLVEADEDRIVIYDSNCRCTYTLGKKEYELLKLFEIGLSIEDIQMQYKQYSLENIEELYKYFESRDFFSRNEMEISSFLRNNKKIKKIVKLWGKEILILSIPIFIIGCLILLGNFEWESRVINLFVDLKKHLGYNILLVCAISLVSLCFHELSHTIVAMCFDAVILNFGITLKSCLPYGYTNLSWGTVNFSKAKRICIYLAGILGHLQIAGISFIISYLIKDAYKNYFLLIGLTNIVLGLSNLHICGNSDGSRILSEFLCDSDKEILKKYKEKDLTFCIKKRKLLLSREDLILFTAYFLPIFYFVIRSFF